MPFEYEALVGHLYVVGGRSISTAPPGALVEVAPQKAARGRETDTFFTIVLPSRDAVAPASFYTQMAQHAAERYFASSGSVTAGLREVFSTLNQKLIDHNQGAQRPYEANIICAVLRGSDLIVGRVGGAVTLLYRDDRLVTFPEDLQNDETLYTAPLGVMPIPNVKMSQYRVSNGTRVVFGDTNLADFDQSALQDAVSADEIAATLLDFKELARLQLSLMVIEFVPPDELTPEAIAEGQNTLEMMGQRSTKGQPVEAEGRRSTRSRRESPLWRAVKSRIRHFFGVLALIAGRGLGILDKLMDRLFGPVDDRTRRWLVTPAGASMVIIVPVGVVALVILLWLSGTGESEFELCLGEANRRASLARSVANNERQTVLNAWNVTLSKVAECDSLRPGDPTVAELRREGLDVLDALNQILRREAIRIESLPQASLSQIVIQGQDLYVLDSANQRVYQVSLSSDGMSRTRPGTPIPEMRMGAVTSGIRVGEIFDISYNTNDNTVVAVDQNGVVVQCSPRFLQCSGQQLIGAENWINPVAVTSWSGRLYILDTGVGEGQIWRYEPSGGAYGNPPTEIFTGTTRPQLRAAVDLAIDDFGNIFVLLDEGIILKYRDGQPLDFGYAAFPDGLGIDAAQSMYLNDDPTSQHFYIVNRDQRMIYEVSLGGNFRGAYTIYDDERFELLSAVAAGPGQGQRSLVYAISGNSIFAFDLAR